MRAVTEALSLVESFVPCAKEEKSQQLILALLQHTGAPFSRDQFNPGHITCTAVVLNPDRQRVLLVHHHRLRRWLLPGGHVEESDASLVDTARREATEETSVQLVPADTARLLGLDVHGIPPHPGKHEPFHLHHDLIFALVAKTGVIARSEEAPEVAWCAPDEFKRYDLPNSIVWAAGRAFCD